MIDINLNGALPTHVDRIKPKISVDSAGKINWTPGYLDYNASNYFPGKTVKSEEFNKHNLQHVYQGNYITDVLQLIFDKHLPDAVYKLFTSEFDLVPSFVKTFTADDWGEKQEDGYYYITVTAEEHGFPADTAEGVLERMNIDTEMYLLNTDGNFYEVQQISTASDNTVQAYSDDNTLAGFLVIRTNDKAYALAEASIHANQIVGLADSALSGKYADLVDLTRPDGTGPDDRITANAKGIASILSGVDDDNKVVKAAKALQADNAKEATAMLGTGTLGGRVIDNIFEVGSNTVKKATNADNAKEAINATKINNLIINIDEDPTVLFLKGTSAGTLTVPVHKDIAIDYTNSSADYWAFNIPNKFVLNRRSSVCTVELFFVLLTSLSGSVGSRELRTSTALTSVNAVDSVLSCSPICDPYFNSHFNKMMLAPYVVIGGQDDNTGITTIHIYRKKVYADGQLIELPEDWEIDFPNVRCVYGNSF